jgi:hypothetical protein
MAAAQGSVIPSMLVGTGQLRLHLCSLHTSSTATGAYRVWGLLSYVYTVTAACTCQTVQQCLQWLLGLQPTRPMHASRIADMPICKVAVVAEAASVCGYFQQTAEVCGVCLCPADLQMVNMSLRFLSKPSEERLSKIFQVGSAAWPRGHK